ncbi:putative Flagellar assembly protein FliH [Azospirillaceae bacterium]
MALESVASSTQRLPHLRAQPALGFAPALNARQPIRIIMASIRKYLFEESFDAEQAHRSRAQREAEAQRHDSSGFREATFKPATKPPPKPSPQSASTPSQTQQTPAQPQSPPPPPLPPPQMYTSEQFTKARSDGYNMGEMAGRETGYNIGHAEAMREIENRTAAALERTAESIGRLISERHSLNHERSTQPLRLALAIARKVMPEMARRHGLGEVEAMISNLVGELIDEPRLVIRVGGGAQTKARETLENVLQARGFGGRVVVLEDTTLGAADCRVEWAEGGAERSTAQLLTDIEQAAARLGAAP